MNALAILFFAVVLQWDQPADLSITGYKVYWGLISGTYTQNSDAGLNSQETLSDDLFLPGVTYFFVARSYNAAGLESANSNEVSWARPALPTPTPAPSPPQNLRFQLIVINGSGDGSYEVGTLVLVVADHAPQQYAFSRWDGDWVILSNPFLRRTTATIPSMDVTIEALYEPK
jgi:hypothetical protein